MLHTGLVENAAEAIALYGKIRTLNGSGVTIPSQIRYVHYYEKCMQNGFPVTDTVVELNSIKIAGKIKVSGWVWFIIKNGGRQVFSSRVSC
jgi:phosphatidylinositol-3,4,5-trisphosphate 3-phosphatase/dual-specificity protein phosphatase PTEN